MFQDGLIDRLHSSIAFVHVPVYRVGWKFAILLLISPVNVLHHLGNVPTVDLHDSQAPTSVTVTDIL
jgi:hypothetical protein